VRRNSVELQFEMLAVVRRIEPEIFPVPSDAAIAKSLRAVCAWIEGLLNGPIVRQIDRSPLRIIELRRRSAG